MTRISTAFLRVSAAIILAGAALMWSGQLPSAQTSSLISAAQAQNAGSSAPKAPAGATKDTTNPAKAATAGALKAPVCKDEMDEYGTPKKVCR